MLNFYLLSLFVLVHLACFSQPKQIIVILADDLGFKDVGFNGSSYYQTPYLNELANNSLNYTQAYANASNCAPSRASLLTGTYSPRHGVYTVSPPDRGHEKTRKLVPSTTNRYIDSEIPTLASYFQDAGFKTAAFGKWHIGEDPLKQGFDVYKGGVNGTRSYFSPYGLAHLEDGPEGEELTQRLNLEAIEFIKKNKNNNFFLYLAHYAIHTPLQGPQDLVEKYGKIPPRDGQGNNVHYSAMVENLDKSVGVLLNSLKEIGIHDPLIIFSSDNGGIAHLSRQWPLRAGKGSYYEGGIRVPFLIKHSSIPVGVNTTPIMLFDVFPTLLNFANISLPKEVIVDAKDLKPTWEEERPFENRPLFFHFPFYLEAYAKGEDDSQDALFRTRPGSALRRGDWKLIYFFENGDLELYNLKQDPGERINLVASEPHKAETMLAELKDVWVKTGASIPTEANPKFDPLFIP